MEDENRSRYKVFVEFEEGTEDEEGTIKGKLRLYGDEGEPGINIRPLGECKYEKNESFSTRPSNMERHLTTLELSYKYTDVTFQSGLSDNLRSKRFYDNGTPDQPVDTG